MCWAILAEQMDCSGAFQVRRLLAGAGPAQFGSVLLADSRCRLTVLCKGECSSGNGSAHLLNLVETLVCGATMRCCKVVAKATARQIQRPCQSLATVSRSTQLIKDLPSIDHLEHYLMCRTSRIDANHLRCPIAQFAQSVSTLDRGGAWPCIAQLEITSELQSRTLRRVCLGMPLAPSHGSAPSASSPGLPDLPPPSSQLPPSASGTSSVQCQLQQCC